MTTKTKQEENLRGWIGHDLVDEQGSKIGRIDEVYVDHRTGQPEWIAVTTGWFGARTSFVPLRGLTSSEDVLVSPWDGDKVKDAPHAEPDGELSESEEAALYAHYDMAYGEDDQRNRSTTDTGHDTSGPDTDSAMTRSEEELKVGTTKHEAGRARLRKYIETEHQTVTVPVRKERVEVVREPITDANRSAATSGPELSEEEHEMVLNEEEVDVDTRVVPKERVRLDKDVVTEDQRVDADLRKERIDVEGDVQEDAGRRR
jgi:uncharacterized protein (TIGR02271 family)